MIYEAIPYKKEFIERDWGFCISQKIKDCLTDELYNVNIHTDYSFGELKVGDVTISGKSLVPFCTLKL